MNVIFQAETARVVWSYHSQDPSSLTQLGSLVHQEKGSASLNLLGGSIEDRVETNSASFSITSDNVCSLLIDRVSEILRVCPLLLNTAILGSPGFF